MSTCSRTLAALRAKVTSTTCPLALGRAKWIASHASEFAFGAKTVWFATGGIRLLASSALAAEPDTGRKLIGCPRTRSV